MRLLRRLAILGFGLMLTGCQASVLRMDDDATLKQSARESYALAEEWLLENVKDNGAFRYRYDPLTDEEPAGNNPIRQLMAARLLAALSRERPELLPLHRKNMAFYLTYWYKERDGLGYVLYEDSSKLGANAMLLRAFVASPDAASYAAKARTTAEGILSLQNADGTFRPWFIAPEDPGNEQYLLTFYSGEAILALAEYYGVTRDPRILDAAVRAQDAYVDLYVDRMDGHYYPAYVPWHTMSLSALWKVTQSERYRDAVFTLNDKLLELLDRRTFIGRFYNPATPRYGSPHSSSDGVYTEGLAYAYELARDAGDAEREERYREALALAVFNLRSLQYGEEEAAEFPNPNRARGALRVAAGQTEIRVDCVQHAMDAYRKILNF